jgi:hypothetical protein
MYFNISIFKTNQNVFLHFIANQNAFQHMIRYMKASPAITIFSTYKHPDLVCISSSTFGITHVQWILYFNYTFIFHCIWDSTLAVKHPGLLINSTFGITFVLNSHICFSIHAYIVILNYIVHFRGSMQKSGLSGTACNPPWFQHDY